MARTRTAENIVADIRKRADMVGSDFVSDDEVLELFNQEIAELRGVIRRAEGQPYVRAEHDITVTAGSSTYPLPDSFAELLSVKRVYAGRTVELKPFMEFERSGLGGAPAEGAPTWYRLNGDNIDFLPATVGAEITIAYIPTEDRLQFAPGTPNTFDGVMGYEVAAIYGAVAACLQKEESDPSFYLGQKDRIIRHIQAMAAQRDGGQPERVQDVVGWDPYGI